jgi:hypothetical protein
MTIGDKGGVRARDAKPAFIRVVFERKAPHIEDLSSNLARVASMSAPTYTVPPLPPSGFRLQGTITGPCLLLEDSLLLWNSWTIQRVSLSSMPPGKVLVSHYEGTLPPMSDEPSTTISISKPLLAGGETLILFTVTHLNGAKPRSLVVGDLETGKELRRFRFPYSFAQNGPLLQAAVSFGNEIRLRCKSSLNRELDVSGEGSRVVFSDDVPEYTYATGRLDCNSDLEWGPAREQCDIPQILHARVLRSDSFTSVSQFVKCCPQARHLALVGPSPEVQVHNICDALRRQAQQFEAPEQLQAAAPGAGATELLSATKAMWATRPMQWLSPHVVLVSDNTSVAMVHVVVQRVLASWRFNKLFSVHGNNKRVIIEHGDVKERHITVYETAALLGPFAHFAF